MKNFIFLFSLLIIVACSETPTDVPIGSYRDIEFRVDMNSMINDGVFDIETDILKVLLDSTQEFEMTDGNNDNIFSCIISDLILSQTYQYQYMINNIHEELNGERSLTVSDDNDILDYYGELNPTTLTFLVDMSYQIEIGNFVPESQFLDVAGDFNSWQGGDLLEAIDNNIYTTTILNVEFDETVEFKFRINGDWAMAEFPNGGPNRSYYVDEEGEHEFGCFYNDESGD